MWSVLGVLGYRMTSDYGPVPVRTRGRMASDRM